MVKNTSVKEKSQKGQQIQKTNGFTGKNKLNMKKAHKAPSKEIIETYENNVQDVTRKIKKPSRAITSLKVKENFESFYTGGEIKLIPESGQLFALLST